MRKPIVILFAYYYHPQTTSGVQRASRIARYLPECGLDVRVIASSREGVRPDLQDVIYVPHPDGEAGQETWEDRLAGALQWAAPYNEQYLWIPPAVRAAEQLVRQTGRVVGMISTSPPVGGHLAAWVMKRRNPGLRWVADFRDPILGNPTRNRKWAGSYDKALERLIFRRADRAVAVSDEFVKKWTRTHTGLDEKFEVIWNGFDPAENFGPLPVAEGNRRVLLHAGMMYRLRHPVPVLSALDRLTTRGRLDPATFVLRFVGPFESRADFLETPGVARMMGLGCLEAEGTTVSRKDAMHQIATAHSLFLIDLVNEANAGYTVPAKIFDYVLTGRPILAVTGNGSPVDSILRHSRIPNERISYTESEADLEEKLLRFLALPTEPVQPSEWFSDRFDGRKQVAAMAALLVPRDASGQQDCGGLPEGSDA